MILAAQSDEFVHDPFTTGACFDLKAMARVVAVAVRMLDNVLDAAGGCHANSGRRKRSVVSAWALPVWAMR